MRLPRLRAMRSEKKLRQAELSEILHINQHTYSCYEIGKYRVSLETLIRIADYYNTSLDYLAGRTNKRERH